MTYTSLLALPPFDSCWRLPFPPSSAISFTLLHPGCPFLGSLPTFHLSLLGTFLSSLFPLLDFFLSSFFRHLGFTTPFGTIPSSASPCHTIMIITHERESFLRFLFYQRNKKQRFALFRHLLRAFPFPFPVHPKAMHYDVHETEQRKECSITCLLLDEQNKAITQPVLMEG